MVKSRRYEIRVHGAIPPGWRDRFAGLMLRPGPGDELAISGDFPDQAALYGLLAMVRALELELVSLERVP